MPVVATDDASRRIRDIFLGPPGWRWPDARFEAYYMWAALTAGFAVLAVLVLPTLRLDITAVAVSWVLPIPITRKVMRRVEHDQSVRYWLSVVRAEIHSPRPCTKGEARTITTPADLFIKGTHR